MFLLIKIAGVLALCFNLFTFWKIYKADIKEKWWKFVLPLFVNFPTFVMSLEGGFDWKFFAFQVLGSDLAIGFQSHFAVAALPIGSLYIWWKMGYWESEKNFADFGREKLG